MLHGACSVPGDHIRGLIEDGVCKVSLWTVLERDAAPVLFREMVKNASKVAGCGVVEMLKNEGLLGNRCLAVEKASLDFFTTL